MHPRVEGIAVDFKELDPELLEKAKVCKTSEELLALAKREGYKLSEAELETIAGGGSWSCECIAL